MGTRVTEHVIEEVRARVDIVELIGARMTLKKSGATFKGCCPFHREKTPSFHVNPVKQFYHCFGCGEHGDIFTFLMKQEGLTFMDAVRTLAERVGVTIEQDVDYGAQQRAALYAIHAELTAFYRRCLLQTKEAEPARGYLRTRKLADDVAERFSIGYAPTQPRDALLQWADKYHYTAEQLVAAGLLSPPNNPARSDDYFDRFRGRLMFPICDRQGRVVAFSGRILDAQSHPAKYVNSPETEIFTKSRILYALDKAAPKIVKHPRREAIVCEGQIDVIRCHASGFETAVASQGTAFTKEHVSILKKYADSVVLVFDGDGAGHKAALRTGALFLEEEIPVRVAVLPKGDDPDSLLRDKGPDAFRELLDNAVSITAFQIDTLLQNEAQPDTIDALNRVAHGVLETLAPCPGAVLRARLLQEASEKLHLPYSALEDDLEKTREALKARAAQAEAYRNTHEPQPEAAAPATADRAFADESTDAPLDEPRPAPLPRAEHQLCELLIQHENDPGVLELVETYLPPDLLAHPLARDIVAALQETRHTGTDRLAPLRETLDEHLQPLFDAIIVAEGKLLSAREATPTEAVQDLITRLWTQRLKEKRGRLSADSSPENDRQRLQLSCLIKSLETQPWKNACKLMTAESADTIKPEAFPSGPPAVVRESAAEPYEHEADTASAAFDPEEFPPSGFQPDETLD